MIAPSLQLWALTGIPLVQAGDDLAALIADALKRADLTPCNGDALVITSKVVSKAEDCFVELASITPSDEALRLAEITRKDPRMVELVLRESVSVSRAAPHVLVTQHRLGFVSANGGIDQSNIEHGDVRVLLLPADPDASAAAIRVRLHDVFGVNIGVIISDSHGRPFRIGNIGVAIGVSGMPALVDLRGERDLFGRELRISIQGYADMIASAAALVSGEGAEGLPVVLVRGLIFAHENGRASDLNRPPQQDLYR